MRASLLAVATLSALSIQVTPTRAQPSAPASVAAESPEYKQTIEAALDEYRLQHFEEARTLFARAHRIEPSARTERGMGMVEFELRHYVNALRHLDAALASSVRPLTDEQRRSVEDLRARAAQFVAQYKLELDPPAADIALELDGKRVDAGPTNRVTLEAGEHTLRLSGPDLVARELHIDVKGGEQQTLHIQLEVKTEPPAASVSAEPVAPQRSRLALALAAGGAGVAVVGGVLGGVALAKAGDAESGSGSDADSARALALGADIALGVGIAGVVAGGIVWLVQRRHGAPAEHAHVRFVGSRLTVGF